MKKLLLFILTLLPGLALAEPISAIAAIASMSGAAGAAGIGGVLAGGLAGVASLGLAGGMMFVGGALSLVGSITGNKKLTKLGGALGLAGGVGKMFTSLSNLAGEGVKEGARSAAAATLDQTAADAITSPAAEMAADAAGMTAEEALAAAQAQGLGTDDLASAAEGAAKSSAKDSLAATPFRPSANYGDAMSGAETAAFDKGALRSTSAAGGSSGVGDWFKSNKELVDFGSGILKGAGQAYAHSKPSGDMKARLAAEEEQRRRFNESITGMRPVGQFIDPNVDPTAGRQVRNPIRYVPRPGLLRAGAGG